MVKQVTPTDSSIRPNSKVTLSVVQVFVLIGVIGSAGFTTGALYPRLTAAESALAKVASNQDQMALTLAALLQRVESMERQR